MTQFESALLNLPRCIAGQVDLLGQHKTVADLVFMARHELDLAEEGEIELLITDIKQLTLFIERYRAS